MSTTPTFSRPRARDLASYVEWIKAITQAVGGVTVDDPVKDSPEIWQRDWQDFWRRVDETPARNAAE